MRLLLGCIADDYTGASDLANTLAQNGLRTIQTIGIPHDDLTLPPVDAVVIALKIRSCAPDEAVAAAAQAERFLRGRGASHILYKICSTFDSTDQGNIGPVLDALRATTSQGCVLVTPAFPQTGRTVYMGHLFVNGVPLDESPLKDHPLNPMSDANLVRVLARQSQYGVSLIARDQVAKGDEAVLQHLAALTAEGKGAAIIDAIDESDLITAGRVALHQGLSVGASGLGLGLARALVTDGNRTAPQGAPRPAIDGPGICLAGSCSQATLAQIAEAEKTMPVLRLDSTALIEGEGESEKALAFARQHLPHGPVLIAASRSPQEVAAVQERFGVERAGHAIEQAMAELAEQLRADGVRRFVVAGGETSGAVVDRLGLRAFLLGPEIAAGVPVLYGVGQKDGPIAMALKSGNFGGPRFFEEALALMP
jgi:uncharacterized protein YgbK (DUF1537 family)